MKYKILEGIATADIAYKVYGESLEELFQNAAEAVSQTMCDLKTINPINSRQSTINNRQLDNLLLDFLNELIFLKDSKQMVFSRFDIKINKLDARRYQLDAIFWGEKIDPKKHKLRTDVKAVTKHRFEIKKTKKGFKAIVVLDI